MNNSFINYKESCECPSCYYTRHVFEIIYDLKLPKCDRKVSSAHRLLLLNQIGNDKVEQAVEQSGCLLMQGAINKVCTVMPLTRKRSLLKRRTPFHILFTYCESISPSPRRTSYHITTLETSRTFLIIFLHINQEGENGNVHVTCPYHYTLIVFQCPINRMMDV